jgi:hypothetical protein
MGKPATLFLVPPRQSPQLRCLNDKISRLAGTKPYGDFYHVFSLAARLAGNALEAAQELQELPGIDVHAFDPAHTFWHRLRDYNGAAALNCAGGNQTLAEALVTYRLLRSIGEYTQLFISPLLFRSKLLRRILPFRGPCWRLREGSTPRALLESAAKRSGADKG